MSFSRFLKVGRTLVSLSYLALFLSAATISSPAQITAVTADQRPPIPGAGHDYIKLFNETVSPSVGAVDIHIDAGPPAGRGVSVPFAIGYDSNSARHFNDGSNIPYDNGSYLAQGGWRLMVPSLQYSWSVLPIYGPGANANTIIQWCDTVDHYMFTDPGGTLSPLGLNQSPMSWQNCTGQGLYWNTPTLQNTGGLFTATTTSLPSSTGPNANHPPAVTIFDHAGTLYSFSNSLGRSHTPGAYWSLTVNGNPIQASLNTLSGLPDFIEDRNGNRVVFSVDENGSATSSGAFHITDTLGRTAVSASSFGNPNGDTVSVSGLAQPYKLTWGTANFSWTYNAHIIAPPLSSFWYCSVPNGSNPNGHIGNTSGPDSADATGTVTGSSSVVTSLQLPNGLSYQFLYDNPNNDNPFGLLRQIIYPNGAYVRYVWTQNTASTPITYPAYNVPPSGALAPPPNTNLPTGFACEGIFDVPAVAKRFVSFDGVHEVQEQDFSYSTSWTFTNNGIQTPYKMWTQKQTTVRTKDLATGTSFKTVYTYTPIQDLLLGNDVEGTIAATTGVYPSHPGEKTVQSYDANGALLRTVTKSYLAEYLPPDVLTTLDNGQSSYVHTAYLSTSNTGTTSIITDVFEYDFGTQPDSNSPGPHGPLLQHIHADYNHAFPLNPLMPAATTTAPFNPAILDRPSDVITYDGSGNRMAEIDYCFDGDTSSFAGCGKSSLASASATGHDDTNFSTSFVSGRGNATTKIAKCFSGTAQTACPQGDSITVYSYDQTGQQVSRKDPNGNITTYTFADSFFDPAPPGNTPSPPGSTNAYLTQITSPSTNGVSHIESFSYAYSDGALTVLTDENRNQTKYIYNDGLRRLTETDFPDDGQTTVTYNDSGSNPEVVTNKKIDSSHTLTTTVMMDGMGHSIQTQLNSDPAGVDYTDTTYDGHGRVISASNPHRSTSAPTDGITQTQYDGFGRVTQVTQQDGSVSNVSYSANCSIALDEAGHRRRSCNDALGRLTEVDEPTPGVSESIQATNAAASVTLSGNLESEPSSNPAIGSVTITGTDSIIPATSSYDFGTVTVTIGTNAFVSAPYGNNGASPSAPSDVAGALCSQITNASSTNTQVSCSTSGGIIILTAQAPGTAGNGLALAVNSRSLNPQSSQSAFASSFTSGSLSGGGATIYDSGTTSITVSNRAYSVRWLGSTTTAAGIASSLAAAINNDAGAYATAGASGSTVFLAANDVGMSGNNIALSCSSGYDTTDFSSPSFSISCPAVLSGGQEAGSLSAPAVTLYSYDALSNLLQVTQQGGTSDQTRWRIRTFTYDSLSHLVTATNPESGKIRYLYDANGNVVQKISPQANQTGTATQTISYCYDALNRLTDKSYTAQAPAYGQPCSLTGIVVHNNYDSGTNGIGRLTSLTDQAGSGSYTYESMGRIAGEQRTIAGISKSMSYLYNLDGSIRQMTYPSTAVLAYTQDSVGRVGSVQDVANGINYVTGTCGSSNNLACYDPTGALTGFLSGVGSSFAGISNSFTLNNRLQPVNMSAVAPNPGVDATAAVTVSGSLQTTSGTTPTSGTASITLSGNEQSKQVQTQGASAGSGSVTIGGGEQSRQIQGRCTVDGGCIFTTVYDAGTVTITVNGRPTSYSFGQGDTAGSVAGHLITNINNDAGAVVWASPNGSATVNLTARTNGSGTNYPLSVSTTSAFGSFPSSASASSLTGGQDAVSNTVYDSGACSITLNGRTYSTSFGQGDSVGSIASRLAANISNDTLASAAVSGATISLTAKATGAAGNYPLSSSCSYSSANFSGPSFSLSASAALAGGANAGPSTTDAGTVSLNIGSFTASACYGNSTNSACSSQQGNNAASQVAAALAGAINVATSPATATVNGTVLNLSWKTSGNVTTAVSALSTTHDQPSLFPNPSFTSAAGNFSGGGPITVFSLTYDFHAGNGDNGNVYGITNNRDTTRNQTFTYDALNRLISAQNAGTDCTQMTANGATKFWGNSYSYDAWGNLLQKTPTKCSAENLNVWASAGNQIHTVSGPDYQYDAAGNMTQDVTTGNNYSYNPENRITGAGGFTYTYDSDGNRVEKSNGSTGTIYWSMTPGIVAESDLKGNLTSEYVFFDGKRVARKDLPSGAISYYFSDHLGTASVITDSAGNVTEDEDYYPWGGELQFVNSGANHYKFTGKERDNETGLDYFGARYYGNWLGRFSSPDEPLVDQDVQNPQSLNLYTYALNNPVRFRDADGRTVTVCINLAGGDQSCSLVSDKDYAAAQAADKAAGINAPELGQSGNITCGGAVCGQVQYGCAPCMADAITPLTLGPGDLILFGPGRAFFAGLARDAGAEAAEMAAKMAGVRAAGEAGEIAAGIIKNTRQIVSETGTAAFRVPDILDDSAKVIGEVKNVSGRLSLTNQIKDFVAFAQKNGYSFELHVPQSTTFTAPLQNLINSGAVTLVRY